MIEPQVQAGTIPEWDLADRMKKSLRHSGVPVQSMADYLDVARETVSTWINGRIKPSKQTLRLWAMRCGVPLEWLETGAVLPGGPKTNLDLSPMMACIVPLPRAA